MAALISFKTFPVFRTLSVRTARVTMAVGQFESERAVRWLRPSGKLPEIGFIHLRETCKQNATTQEQDIEMGEKGVSSGGLEFQ